MHSKYENKFASTIVNHLSRERRESCRLNAMGKMRACLHKKAKQWPHSSSSSDFGFHDVGVGDVAISRHL